MTEIEARVTGLREFEAKLDQVGNYLATRYGLAYTDI